jgi:ferritin-like metal-binding protein YciE
MIKFRLIKIHFMPNETTTIKTLKDLLDHDVQHLVSAEVQLEKIMPSWINKCSSFKLKTVLHKYLETIDNNVMEFNRFLEEEAVNSVAWHNRIMQAFIDETEEKLSNCSGETVKDASLLASVQRINHFKISAYGTAAAFANALGMEQAATIFHTAEVKEKQIDDRLSQLADHEINKEAKSTILLPD